MPENNSKQEEGFVGQMVGRMIERTVRRQFRQVRWRAPETVPSAPTIFCANHHGWHDGYLMFHVVKKLGMRSLDWITEFDAFPLFAKVGGMPFPADRPQVRAATIRRTVRLMREERRSLILFPEGTLHEPPELLPFGGALKLLGRAVPGATLLPVGITYRLSLHERPEAVISFGSPMPAETTSPEEVRAEVQKALDQNLSNWGREEFWTSLVEGTLDVNERWDFRSRFGKK